MIVSVKPVDFRKAMDGLVAYAKESIKADLFSEIIYVFRAKRAHRVKLIHSQSACICAQRGLIVSILSRDILYLDKSAKMLIL